MRLGTAWAFNGGTAAVGYSGPITNIVVVMFENRSYDNVLGMLYNPGNPAPYTSAPAGQAELDGLPLNASNVDPLTGVAVNVWGDFGDSPTIPETDPGEPFYDMAQQIQGAAFAEGDNPYASSVTPTSPMGGFVANYRAQFTGGQTKNSAGIGNVQRAARDIMHFYTPWTMPVTAYLANTFMVCDRWFGSVPTQTFANRMFAHCANPGGTNSESYLDDGQYLEWGSGGFALPNVFAQLDAVRGGSGPNWKVYFHDYSISLALVKTVNNCKLSASNVNVASYDQTDYPGKPNNGPITTWPSTFLEDAHNGTLPPYSFIEPRYSNSYKGFLDVAAVPGLAPNSNHPGLANYLTNTQASNLPISVLHGELFLLSIYTALLNSPQWNSTLLIVVYDEHGGLYDHVYPPGVPTNSQGGVLPSSSDYGNFAFDVYGPRVPAIVVSPYVTAGSRLAALAGSAPFDHTSIIRTVWECFNLDQGTNGKTSINARDANAPSVLSGCQAAIVNTPPNPPSF